MINTAHVFDIDTLIKIDSKVWLVSKHNPSIPVIKISQSEFNTMKKGIYKKFDSNLEIGNTTYWLSNKMLNDIKIECKRHKIDITDLVFSMQEFMNASIVEHLDYEIFIEHFRHLKNKTDDVYVICSKSNQKSYKPIIERLEEELKKLGIEIKKYHYLSETFYNRDSDYICNKKVKILLQLLTGQKTEDDKFIDEEVSKYDKVYFYDDELSAIKFALESNYVFQSLISNTEDSIKRKIKDLFIIKHSIIVNRVTNNKINPFLVKEVVINWSHLIKTFEGFRY